MYIWREYIIFEDCWIVFVFMGIVLCYCNEVIFVVFSSFNFELVRVFLDFLDLIKIVDIV